MKEYKIKSHTGAEISFTTEVSGHDTKLIICSYGPDFSGKSRFAVTGPTKHGLVGIVPTDRKTRLTVKQNMEAMGLTGRILMPKDDLVREVNPTRLGWSSSMAVTEAEKKSKEHYRRHVDRVKETAWALHAHPDVSLICIDLFQQFWQDLKYACYGRTQFAYKKIDGQKPYQDTSEAATELIDFISSISDKHLILTHKTKDEYDNNVNTGRQTWEGFKYMGNHVNLVVEHHNNKKWNPEKPDDEARNWHYGLSIRKCQWNTEVEGEAGDVVLKDEWVTFQNLAMLVLPASRPEDWE